MMVERLLVGVGMVLLLKFNVKGVLPMPIFVIIGIFIAVKKPYK
jgi:hypothetical protein